MRVCKEWGSLLLNENVKVVSENQAVTDWLEAFFSQINIMMRGPSYRGGGLDTFSVEAVPQATKHRSARPIAP